jgi:hypothetical protein
MFRGASLKQRRLSVVKASKVAEYMAESGGRGTNTKVNDSQAPKIKEFVPLGSPDNNHLHNQSYHSI